MYVRVVLISIVLAAASLANIFTDGLKAAGKGAEMGAKAGGKLAGKGATAAGKEIAKGTKKGVHGMARGTEKGAAKVEEKTSDKPAENPN